jgi:chromate reductase
MTQTKNIFAITGSARRDSSNLKLIKYFAGLTGKNFNVAVFDRLNELPHFDADLSIGYIPRGIVDFRNNIDKADGVLICTPEYVFSIPSGLKNAIEWCVATTVFSNKPIGLITASAHGQKGHDELKLIMRTVDAKFTEETTLLIQGVKGKMNDERIIPDTGADKDFKNFIEAYKDLIKNIA